MRPTTPTSVPQKGTTHEMPGRLPGLPSLRSRPPVVDYVDFVSYAGAELVARAARDGDHRGREQVDVMVVRLKEPAKLTQQFPHMPYMVRRVRNAASAGEGMTIALVWIRSMRSRRMSAASHSTERGKRKRNRRIPRNGTDLGTIDDGKTAMDVDGTPRASRSRRAARGSGSTACTSCPSSRRKGQRRAPCNG